MIFADLLSVMELPVFIGGMSVRITTGRIVRAAVQNGIIGSIGAALVGADELDFKKNFREANVRALKKEIAIARDGVKGPIAVNVMKVLTNYVDMVETSIREGVDIIFCGSALPLDLPKYLIPGRDTMLIPKVKSARAAVAVAKRWISAYHYVPPAIVIEGPEAGGHLGFTCEEITDPTFQIRRLVKEAVEALRDVEKSCGKKIPIIAAGGIYTGQDIRDLLNVGAVAVKMATIFVPTEECDAHPNFKAEYVRCKKSDLTIIESPVGLLGRVIRNQFVDDMERGDRKPFSCPHHCIASCKMKDSPYCIAKALIAAYRGDLDHGFAFAGTNAHRTVEETTVKKVLSRLKDEFGKAS